MSSLVRILLYVVLIAAGVFLGLRFKEAYGLRQQRLNAAAVAKDGQSSGNESPITLTNDANATATGTNNSGGKLLTADVSLSKEKPLGTYGAGLFICIIEIGRAHV